MATEAEAPTITVTFQDILEGRAYVRLSPEAKIKLCHMAGAPWNEKIPDAELHDLQKEVIARPEREKIVHGGSRLGKSVLGGCEALCELMLPGSKTAIVAARYDHVGAEFQYVYRGMKNLFKGHPQAFQRISFRHSQNYHDYEVHTVWNSRCRGYSVDSDDGAALLGQEFSRVVLGEGSHISQEILEKRILRALDGWLMQSLDGMTREGGYLSIYTTPKGFLGCSAYEWERVQRTTRRQPEKLHYGNVPFAETVWIREASILENPYYDRTVYEARKKGLTKDAHAEQYDGKMTFSSGRIYEEYDEDLHFVEPPSPYQIRNMRLGLGIDTGAYFGAVLMGIDKAGTLWCLGEVYTEQQTIGVSCDEVGAMIVEVLGPVYGTTDYRLLKEKIELWKVDPASQHKLEIMENLDITVSIPTWRNGKFELLPTLEEVRSYIKHERFYVCNNCEFTHDQLRKYIWKTTRAPGQKAFIKEPKKEYDHLCDGMRFVAIPLMELGPLQEAPPPVTIAEAYKQAQRDRVFGPLREAMNRGGTKGTWV